MRTTKVHVLICSTKKLKAGTTITRLHSPYEETKNTADNSDTATVRIFLCLMPKVSNFHNYSAPKHLREYCQAEENPCLRNQVWSLPTTAEVNLVHHTRSEYCPHHIQSKNCNEAPPLTPLWVRVCINVAHRLPTNVVQRSTSKHTSKNQWSTFSTNVTEPWLSPNRSIRGFSGSESLQFFYDITKYRYMKGGTNRKREFLPILRWFSGSESVQWSLLLYQVSVHTNLHQSSDRFSFMLDTTQRQPYHYYPSVFLSGCCANIPMILLNTGTWKFAPSVKVSSFSTILYTNLNHISITV